MATMKAVRIHAYGGPEVLTVEEAPVPTPGPGEVLVRVIASSINPFDTSLRAGYMAPYFNHILPLVIGTDFAGTVEAVGSDVSSFRPGDRVFGRGGVSRDGSQAAGGRLVFRASRLQAPAWPPDPVCAGCGRALEKLHGSGGHGCGVGADKRDGVRHRKLARLS